MADKVLRCAVYTRKSTEDGLEQEFNSLDAQYEACTAYALSQRHEGWVVTTERYDDGGFSGGNMERPGLKRLLVDVAAGRVDIILLYKIDRLTRNLSDFARIVEVLDKAGASFVSITQSFNTTTSMGRLTLNMLLSFAQFEREVTGERIRDKIAASKRKGLWMGGPVPLGYDVDSRRLVVNETEAQLVRHIMRRYLALGSVVELADDLNRDGYRTKVQNRTSGPNRGGRTFQRGTLYHLLSNRIYRGMIVHKGEAFPGEHDAIVPSELWDEVQEALAARASGTSRRLGVTRPSLLTGMITDGNGRPMTPTHARRSGKRYRYYVTRPSELDGSPAWRVSAHDLEGIVCARLAELLEDRQAIAGILGDGCGPHEVEEALSAANLAAATLRHGKICDQLVLLRAAAISITLNGDCVEIAIEPPALAEAVGITATRIQRQETILLMCAATKVRRGHQLRLIIDGPRNPAPRTVDLKLVSLLAEAHTARQLVIGSPGRSVAAIAAEAGRCRTRLARLLPIACLAPDIVVAVTEGRQPAGLDVRALLAADLPMDWASQRRVLGLR